MKRTAGNAKGYWLLKVGTMITICPNCSTSGKSIKTRQIDASVYVGDYHSPASANDWSPGRQCVECGAVIHVTVFKKGAKRTTLNGFANLPPRKNWETPIA